MLVLVKRFSLRPEMLYRLYVKCIERHRRNPVSLFYIFTIAFVFAIIMIVLWELYQFLSKERDIASDIAISL